jgi:hypothetical protein
MAKSVWALAKEEIVEHICNVQEQNAKAWLAAVTSSPPKDELTRTMVTLWAIWHAKRKVIYENLFQSPLSTHSFVERFMTDLEVSVSRPEVRKRADTTTLRWIPPPQGVAKINVDAALSKNTSTTPAAAVARDASGIFLGASSVVIQGIIDPETIKVLVFREGLALANDLSLRRVRIASDCANAVRSLAYDILGVYSHIVKEIKADPASFQGMEFVHEKREANHDAHVLARSTLFSSIGRHVWSFYPPDGVCN